MVTLPRNFLRKMRRAIGGAHTVGSVEHTGNKDKALTRISGVVLPTAPDIFACGIASALDMGHDRTHDDGDQHTGQDEEHPKITDMREKPVHEENDAATKPCADDEAHKDMPCLRDEAWMHEGIHGDSLLP